MGNRGARLCGVALLTTLGLALYAGAAHAQNGCDPVTVLASTTLSGVTTLKSFNDAPLRTNPSADGGTWYAYGSTLGRFWTTAGGHAVGTLPNIQATVGVGTTIAAEPIIAHMVDNAGSPDTLSVIFSGSNGYVYRYDLGPTATSFTYKWGYDTRRKIGSTPVCPADTLTSSPAVLLWEYRTSPTGTTQDIIMVATHNQCNDHSANRVIALKGSDGTLLWSSNTNLALDFGTSLVPEYGVGVSNNWLYATFSALAMAAQPTLMKFNILSSGAATNPQWSGNHGDLRSPARVMPNGELFFITYNGALRVVQASDGLLLALQPLSATANFIEPAFIVTGNAGSRSVYAVDTNGYLHGDSVGTGGSPITQIFSPFRPNNVAAAGPPTIDAYRSKLFATTSTGRVYQYSIPTAAPTSWEAEYVIGTGTTLQPAASVESTNPGEQVNRLTVVSATSGSTSVVKTVCAPAGDGAGPGGGSGARSSTNEDPTGEGGALPQAAGTNCTNDLQCAAWTTGCTTGKCTYVAKNGYSDTYGPLKGVCVAVPANAGAACSDSTAGCNLATNKGICIGGTCQPDPAKYLQWAGTCTCSGKGTGYAACPPPSQTGGIIQSCCGAAGCIDLATDVNNCGACGFACDPGFLCRAGSCVEPWCDHSIGIGTMNARVTNGGTGDTMWSPVAAAFVRQSGVQGPNDCGFDVAVTRWANNPGAIVRYTYGVTPPLYYPTGSGYHATSVTADRSGKVTWSSYIRDVTDGSPVDGAKIMFLDNGGQPDQLNHEIGGAVGTAPFTESDLNYGAGQFAIKNNSNDLTDLHPPFRVFWPNIGTSNGAYWILDATWNGLSQLYGFSLVAWGINTPSNERVTSQTYAQLRLPLGGDAQHIEKRLYVGTGTATQGHFYVYCGDHTIGAAGTCATAYNTFDEVDLTTAYVPACVPPGPCMINYYVIRKIYPMGQSQGDAIVPVKVEHTLFGTTSYDVLVVQGTDLTVRRLESVLTAYGQPSIEAWFTQDMTASAMSDYGVLVKAPTDLPQGCNPVCGRTGDEEDGDGAAPLVMPPQPSPIYQTASPVANPFKAFWLRPYVVTSASTPPDPPAN